MFGRVLLLSLSFLFTECFIQNREVNDKNYFEYTNVHQKDCQLTFDKSDGVKSQFYVVANPNTCSKNCTHKIECNSSPELKEKVYFSKCCAPDLVYEKRDHSCISPENFTEPIYQGMSFENMVVKANLNCNVIVDHVIESIADLLINYDGSIVLKNMTYSLGNYCLDRFAGSHGVVVRTCETTEVCQGSGDGDAKMPCVKKCCPDGQFFVKATCQPASGYGLYLDSSYNNIQNEDGMYIYNNLHK